MGRKALYVSAFRPVNTPYPRGACTTTITAAGDTGIATASAPTRWRRGGRTRGGGSSSRSAINVVLLLAEAIGGILTGSLAVLADAGHLLSDVGSIVLALIAARLAARPASSRRTFGYQRSEVLAALVNGLTLVAVSVFIGVEAIGRFSNPPGIAGGGVLALGILGLLGNAAATVYLARG